MSAKNLLRLILLSAAAPPLLLLFVVNELPEKETQKFKARHSFVTFSLCRVLHKNPKNKKNEKKKLDALRCVTAGGGEELKQHCGGWRCINFSNLSVLRRMNFSSFLNNFCLRVFILFFYHFMSCCYFVFFWAAELFQLLFFGFFS